MTHDRLFGNVNEVFWIQPSRNGIVVVAGKNDGRALSDESKCFARSRSVADDIAKANDSLRALALGVGEHVLKRLKIGVDI